MEAEPKGVVRRENRLLRLHRLQGSQGCVKLMDRPPKDSLSCRRSGCLAMMIKELDYVASMLYGVLLRVSRANKGYGHD